MPPSRVGCTAAAPILPPRLLLHAPTSVRAAIAAALTQFDTRVAPAMGARGVELSAATRALAEALRGGSALAVHEALHALRRAMATLGDEFTDQRTELAALTLAVEYAGVLAPPGERSTSAG